MTLMFVVMLGIVLIATAALLVTFGGDAAEDVRETVSERARDVIDRATDRAAVIIDGGERPDATEPAAPFEPVGEQVWVLTEDDLNERIAAAGGQLGPASDVRLTLEQDRVSITFTAFGIPGTYSGNVIARDGMPFVDDTSIDGPLGVLVPVGQIDALLNAELQQAAREQNVSVESVQVQPGQLVFGVSAT